MASYGPATWPSVGVTTSFSGLYPGPTDYPSGTDYTGDAFPATSNLYPSVTTFAGQGNLPILDVYISFSDVSLAVPVWTWINASLKVRQFSVHRTEGETGTATLVLDNRNRDFDPTYVSSPYYPNVRPLNQVWLREQFAGRTNDMFKGYAESYDQQWPSGGWSDAIALVTAADELKVLALVQLPLTNPPRSSYQDVVAFDSPNSYWTMDESAASAVQPPAIVSQDTTAPGVGEDTFVLGDLHRKNKDRTHVAKPVGKKAKKHHKRHFDKPIPIKKKR